MFTLSDIREAIFTAGALFYGHSHTQFTHFSNYNRSSPTQKQLDQAPAIER